MKERMRNTDERKKDKFTDERKEERKQIERR
jgi:hypothetical protein